MTGELSVCLSAEAHQQLLELGGAELERAAPVVKLSYSVQAAELCQDFQEDLQFRFSLGFNTLSVKLATCLLHSSFPLLAEYGQHWILAGPAEK